MARRCLIAGNWKMNGLASQLDFFDDLSPKLEGVERDVLICPPATLISRAVAVTEGSPIAIGGQDCHTETKGAHTGDISAAMLRDTGASHVILGHSERRADHGESSQLVRSKAHAALAHGLTPIICVGETQAEREAGHAAQVVTEQLRASLPDADEAEIIIAYEPVWAIGTGLTASLDDIADMHEIIRRVLPRPEVTRILYGGSVKAENAAQILSLADVDGALVGGASLTAESFAGIVRSHIA
jgi:triosephosphate isomerase